MSAPLLPSKAKMVCPAPGFLSEIREVIAGAKRFIATDAEYGQSDPTPLWNQNLEKARVALASADQFLRQNPGLAIGHLAQHENPDDAIALGLFWRDLDAMNRLRITLESSGIPPKGKQDVRATKHLARGLLNTLVVYRIPYPNSRKPDLVVRLLEQMIRATGLAPKTQGACSKIIRKELLNRKQLLT